MNGFIRSSIGHKGLNTVERIVNKVRVHLRFQGGHFQVIELLFYQCFLLYTFYCFLINP